MSATWRISVRVYGPDPDGAGTARTVKVHAATNVLAAVAAEDKVRPRLPADYRCRAYRATLLD